MRDAYRCPFCQAVLNPDHHHIVLVARRGLRKGLMFLDSRPGDYTAHVSAGLDPRPGEVWDFLCPVCGDDLGVSDDQPLARIDLGDAPSRGVFFSRKAGEHATFVVDGGGKVEAHGEDRVRYEEIVFLKYL